MAIDVVDFVGTAVYMVEVRGMAFRLAKIAPPCGNTFFDLFVVKLPEPFLGLRLKNVDQSAGSEIKLVIYVGVPKAVGGEEAFFRGNFKVGHAVDQIGFGDKDGFDTLLPEIPDHFLRPRP